jgi:hypothetical protein
MAALLRLVLDPTGDDLAAALACEADVFLETYGNTAEQFADEYGPYLADTGFLAVIDEEGTALGVSRFIAPGIAGLKTLNDSARPPWRADGMRAARAAGVDPARTWDIATIAVRKSHGRGGICAAALYHGILHTCRANAAEWIVMILDERARRLLSAAGLATQMLPGTGPGEYLGSRSSTPLWGHLATMFDQQRRHHLDAYRLIYSGIGLDGVELPRDWAWHRRNVITRAVTSGGRVVQGFWPELADGAAAS